MPIPIRDEAAQPETTASQRASSTVLVIDDEHAICIVLTRMLAQLGFTVLTAESGRQGINALRSNLNTISIVLLDVMMPEMSGVMVLKELRELSEGVRIVLMSGYNEQETLQLVGILAVVGFLQKPFTIADLRQVMAQ